jgi:hypothetical protein
LRDELLLGGVESPKRDVSDSAVDSLAELDRGFGTAREKRESECGTEKSYDFASSHGDEGVGGD